MVSYEHDANFINRVLFHVRFHLVDENAMSTSLYDRDIWWSMSAEDGLGLRGCPRHRPKLHQAKHLIYKLG